MKIPFRHDSSAIPIGNATNVQANEGQVSADISFSAGSDFRAEMLGELIPVKAAGLPFGERTMERACSIGIRPRRRAKPIKLRTVRCGRKLFTTKRWALDFIEQCTRSVEGV